MTIGTYSLIKIASYKNQMLLNFCDDICSFSSVSLWFLFLSMLPVSSLRGSMDWLTHLPMSFSNILKGEWAPLTSQTHDQQRSCLEGIEVRQQKTCMSIRGVQVVNPVLSLPTSGVQAAECLV